MSIQVSIKESPSTMVEKEKMRKFPYASSVQSYVPDGSHSTRKPHLCHRHYQSVHVKSWEEALGSRHAHIPLPSRNIGDAGDIRFKTSDQGRRLHQLRLCWESWWSEVNFMVCIHLRMQSCNFLEIETPRMYNSLHNKGQIHSHVWINKRSHLVVRNDGYLSGLELNCPHHSNPTLWLTKRNTRHAESSPSCKDEAHRGEVSWHSGAHHWQEAQILKYWYQGEHHPFPNQVPPRPSPSEH